MAETLKIEGLSEISIEKVKQFIQILRIMDSKKEASPKKLNFGWRGGLSDLKEKYTSVELQHKSMEWR